MLSADHRSRDQFRTPKIWTCLSQSMRTIWPAGGVVAIGLDRPGL
jgi:hypothetical protein